MSDIAEIQGSIRLINAALVNSVYTRGVEVTDETTPNPSNNRLSLGYKSTTVEGVVYFEFYLSTNVDDNIWKWKKISLDSDYYTHKADSDIHKDLSGVDIDHLTGSTNNLQTQINNLSSITNYVGTSPTFADIDTIFTSSISGDAVIVLEDETVDPSGDTTIYVYDGYDWEYVSRFSEPIQGEKGEKGDQGLSAYQVWLDEGNSGTTQDFLNDIKGDKGDQGLSAYQVWLDEGNTGTAQDFFDTLKGEDGLDGVSGDSAYQVWVNIGNSGTEQQFLDSLKGEDGLDGQDGLSAYEVWLAEGNTGSEQDFFESLQGPQGIEGPQGMQGEPGQDLVSDVANFTKTVDTYVELDDETATSNDRDLVIVLSDTVKEDEPLPASYIGLDIISSNIVIDGNNTTTTIKNKVNGIINENVSITFTNIINNSNGKLFIQTDDTIRNIITTIQSPISTVGGDNLIGLSPNTTTILSWSFNNNVLTWNKPQPVTTTYILDKPDDGDPVWRFSGEFNIDIAQSIFDLVDVDSIHNDLLNNTNVTLVWNPTTSRFTPQEFQSGGETTLKGKFKSGESGVVGRLYYRNNSDGRWNLAKASDGTVGSNDFITNLSMCVKASGDNGEFIRYGRVKGLTLLSGLRNKELYLSQDNTGQLIATKPTTGTVVYVGVSGDYDDNGTTKQYVDVAIGMIGYSEGEQDQEQAGGAGTKKRITTIDYVGDTDKVKRIIYEYVIEGDDKFMEQRFSYDNDVIEFTEIQDDIDDTFVRITYSYDSFGRLQVPTYDNITEFSIVMD